MDVTCQCRCLDVLLSGDLASTSTLDAPGGEDEMDDLHSWPLPSMIDVSGDKDNMVATESHPVQCGRMEVLMRNGLERLGLLAGDTMYCVLGKTLIVKTQPQLDISMSVPMCAKLIVSPNNTPP